MERAFLVQHQRSDTEDVKIIGIYSTRRAARAAIERVLGQPGFSTYPDGFTVDSYEVDRDHWAEGFVDL